MHILPALLVALPTAAGLASWWLLAGLVASGVIAALFTGRRRPVPHPLLRAVVFALLGAVAASAFATVVIPQHAGIAAAVVVALASVAAGAGVDMPSAFRRGLTAVLLLAAASFAAIGVGIEPPTSVAPQAPEGAPFVGWLAVAGLFAAPVMVFEPVARRRALARVACSVLAAGAVAAGALYQLGPQRLAASDQPLHDALAAAAASPLTTMLVVALVLGTLPATAAAMSAALRQTAGPDKQMSVAISALAVLAAAVMQPLAVLAAASTVAVTGTLLGWAQERRRDISATN